MNVSGFEQHRQDQHWQEVYTFLSTRLNPSDAVLAPDGLKSIIEDHQASTPTSTQASTIQLPTALTFQNYFATAYLRAEDFNWVVIHKGMINDIDAAFLDQVDNELSPVFANDVFVVFSQKKGWWQLLMGQLMGRSSHFIAYRNLRKQLHQSSTHRLETTDQNTKKQETILTKKLLRSADVLLCSYPKCGRTWLRFMLASYFHVLIESREDMDFRRMDELIPPANKPLDGEGTLLIEPVQTDALKLPLITATHLNYSNPRIQMIFSSKDIIFLVRNIYDVLVSQYFEIVHRRGDKETQDIWTFIREKELIESYVSYLNGWADNLVPDRHIVLTYEGLKADTETELMRLIQFLKLDAIPERLKEAIRLSSFENMQRIQREKRERRGLDDESTNFAGLRVRRGKIGGHRDCLSESEIQFIQAYCRNNLTPAATELLRNNGLDPAQMEWCGAPAKP